MPSARRGELTGYAISISTMVRTHAVVFGFTLPALAAWRLAPATSEELAHAVPTAMPARAADLQA